MVLSQLLHILLSGLKTEYQKLFRVDCKHPVNPIHHFKVHYSLYHENRNEKRCSLILRLIVVKFSTIKQLKDHLSLTQLFLK